MSKAKFNALFAALGAIFLMAAQAQSDTPSATSTNVVTVVVTNYVTITNVVTAPPPAPPATTPSVEMEKKYPWQSSISAGLTLTRGNSHTLLYSGTFLTDKKTPDNEYSLGANGAYGSQNSKDNVNNYGGFGQWNHLFSEKFYGYIRGDAMRDVINDLDYRFIIGPGAGYYLIKETNTTLAVEAGGGMQYQHLGGNYQSFGTARFAERFERKFGDRARLWESVEYLPQVDKFENYTINAELGLEASISKSFSLRTTLDDSYLSEPATGRKRNDIRLVSGIVYKF